MSSYQVFLETQVLSDGAGAAIRQKLAEVSVPFILSHTFRLHLRVNYADGVFWNLEQKSFECVATREK